MKSIKESIIGKRGNSPVFIPAKPEDLENVKLCYLNPAHNEVKFYIGVPNIKHKGIDDVTDFIWSMVFEDRKKVANPTQWVMKNMGLDNSGLTLAAGIRFLSKRSSGTRINSWDSKTVLSDTPEAGVRDNIYNIVCEFDGEYGLDDIALRVVYRYHRGSYRRSLIDVFIFLN